MTETIAIVGPTGQIGSEVCLKLPAAMPIFKGKMNLLNQAGIVEALSQEKFDVLINCAGLTDITYCEEHPEEAFAINAHSVEKMAYYCFRNGKKFIHISDAMVFDGNIDKPYSTECSPWPVNVYGKSKHLGEQLIREASLDGDFTIIRAASVFGPALSKSNFLEKLIASAMRCKEAVKVPSWRLITPTSARVVAKAILACLGRGDALMPNLVHVSCQGGPVPQSEVAAYALARVPSLSHMKIKAIEKTGKSLPRIPAMTALENSVRPPSLDTPTWQNEINDYLLQKGYSRPACAVEVENDVDNSVTKVWEKLQREVVALDELISALRKDRSNWLAGMEGPGRKARKGFWDRFGNEEAKKEEE